MPRISICTNLNDQERDGKAWSGEHENLDYCRKCISNVTVEDLRTLVASKDVPDSQLRAILNLTEDHHDHPAYSGEGYTCQECDAVLTSHDD